MLSIHNDIPNRFLVLERRESFADYSRTYGDQLARHYEDNGAIMVPYMPIKFDLGMAQELEFPPFAKKIGTAQGIDRPMYVRNGYNLTFDQKHPLLRVTNGQVELATYLQAQIASFNAQLSQGLQLLFPRYRLPPDPIISWRMTLTQNEVMHFDSFNGGVSVPPDQREYQRLKVFVNLDSTPRHWRVSHDLPTALKVFHGKLPARLPNDVNVLNEVVNRSALLDDLPAHDLHFPQMSAVIANGETVSHQAMYGRRVVGYETRHPADEMLSPAKCSYTMLKHWITDAGYACDDVPRHADAYIAAKSGYAA